MRPKLIYLDQNMWIALARAYHKHGGGRPYYPTLQRVQLAVDKGQAIFPLSAAHLIETRKTLDLSQRKRLAQVMVDISQGWTLAPADYLVPRELEVAVARLFNEPAVDEPTALGRGIEFAFGRSEQLHIDLGISKQEARLLQAVLDSPQGLALLLVGDDESLNIRGVTGFDDRANLYAQRVEIARKEGRVYSKEVRKRSYIALLTYVLEPELTDVLSIYGKSLEDFLGFGRNRLMAFFDEVPTLNVEIELATERDEHWDRQIDPNDMVDISVLSVAVPYCDVVSTEKLWGHLIRRKKLDEKYDTVLLSDLTELESCLST